MLRNTSAAGLLYATYACLCVSVFRWSQNMHRLEVSFLPRRLQPAGQGECWKLGTGCYHLLGSRSDEGWAWRGSRGGLAVMRCCCR